MAMSTKKIVVFSDIHMTVESEAGKADPARRLRAGLAHQAAVMPDADLILICGDLADRGDEASYRRLKPLVEGSGVPIVMMLGNHDDRDAFVSVFPDAPLDSEGFVQQVVTLGDTRLIVLDTLVVRRDSDEFTHAGELCTRRMAWLDRQLTAAGDAPCIVAMHHPPHDTGFAAMDAIKLRNGDAFHDLVARHGNVRHIIAGHIHRTISGSHRGIPFSIFKGTVAQMPLMFEGTDSAVECDEPPAFGIIMLNGGNMLVHTEDFGEP
jgi:3',5'-cyclic AMP phosphodiesterase CpdA